MDGQRAFIAKTSTAVLKSTLNPSTRGKSLPWNTACVDLTVNIAGSWIMECPGLKLMARSSGTSVLPSTSRSASGPNKILTRRW